MRFGPLPLDDAEGAVLAHSLRVGGRVLKKGLRLAPADLEELRAAGVAEVTAARLGPEDCAEDEAAGRVAAAAAPDPAALGLRVSAPFTGRANLYAEHAGVLLVATEAVAALNQLDEAVTLATLPPTTRVEARRMVATAKIIPFAAPEHAVREAERTLSKAAPALRIAPFRPFSAALFLTKTPGMKPGLLEKGAAAVGARVAALGGALIETAATPHETEALAARLAGSDADMLLVLSASATTDRRDVAPAAIEAAGGRIERLGMPVDPGNLLVLGALEGRPVIGLPGCARSPKLNGADWVMERLAAGIPVDSAAIAAMGVGGLLTEIASRPAPRVGAASGPGVEIGARRPRVSGVLLAAGGSSRMGAGRHKLFEEVDGAPLLRRTAEALAASGLDETVVVLGAEVARGAAALGGLGVRIAENPRWGEGVSASIRTGLAAIDPEADAALIALADMPEVDAALIDRLLAAFAPEERREIVRPRSASGRAGHPVLFGRRFFEALGRLEGDVGARAVVREHGDYVVEIAVAGEAPLVDLDRPEDWARWRAERERI